ncbi:unnamed protein product [Rangifer tarandus platyrhynchus]|uniref:Uncharacterized protein n=2 Tax=Rangifer tarandus platyrhynchus TaxID=3082113 RepID=A0ABN8ZYK2_RANTA|nr:unnamed protein product [Rangifer tarandus platyrhynchus]CAI9710573.1 unnamed protein product [Rangifer tarandus platyrhynchus]
MFTFRQTLYDPLLSQWLDTYRTGVFRILRYDTSPETSLRGSLVQREFFPRGESVRFELSNPRFFEFISVLTGLPGFPEFPELRVSNPGSESLIRAPCDRAFRDPGFGSSIQVPGFLCALRLQTAQGSGSEGPQQRLYGPGPRRAEVAAPGTGRAVSPELCVEPGLGEERGGGAQGAGDSGA